MHATNLRQQTANFGQTVPLVRFSVGGTVKGTKSVFFWHFSDFSPDRIQNKKPHKFTESEGFVTLLSLFA